MFSVCNFFARALTILSPMVVEVMSQPIALIGLFSLAAMLGSCWLRKPPTVKAEPELMAN